MTRIYRLLYGKSGGEVQLAYSKDAYDDKMLKLYEVSKETMVRAGQIKEVD